MNKKELVQKFRPLVRFACSVHNLRNLFRWRLGRGNRVEAPCALLEKVTIHMSGKNNRIIIEDFSRLKNCAVHLSGDNNTIHIGAFSTLINTEFCMEKDGNEILLEEHVRILGKTHLAAIEGTKITIGKDCLFSSDIHFRTGDSHSVLDMEGRRINASEDIVVGEHVWVGTKVTCLKGAVIPPHSIVGACALVTGKFTRPNCVLAGVPAKVVKEQVDWSIARVPLGEKAPDFVAQ